MFCQEIQQIEQALEENDLFDDILKARRLLAGNKPRIAENADTLFHKNSCHERTPHVMSRAHAACHVTSARRMSRAARPFSSKRFLLAMVGSHRFEPVSLKVRFAGSMLFSKMFLHRLFRRRETSARGIVEHEAERASGLAFTRVGNARSC